MDQHLALILAGVLGLGVMSQLASWWLKVPAILFLLLSGIIIGPISGWVDPSQLILFNEAIFFPSVSLAVAVILFEGSLTLNFTQVREVQRVVISLITLGTLITWTLVSLLTYWLIGFDRYLSLLFGAIMVVTGPTVVIPMIRAIRPNNRISQILRWEGILIDPVGALLAVLVFEYIISLQSGIDTSHAFWLFGKTIIVGTMAGMLGGWSLGSLLKRHWLPEYLHNIVSLSLVILIFVLSNEVAEESGLLAVTIMGIWLANTKGVDIDDILSFKEDLTILLVSVLFILLAARIQFTQLVELGLMGFILFIGVQFFVRPIKIFFATLGSNLSWSERALLGWVAPRGIVAAAVSAIFALKLTDLGYPKAELLVPLTFMIIIGTVILQSATARPLANLLGVAEPEPRGVMIVGANRLGRMIGKALHDRGFQVLITDSSWEKIREAKMDGLMTYYGHSTSEHADRHLDLIGLGNLLAISARDEINHLNMLRFVREFGKKNTYGLYPRQKSNQPQQQDQQDGMRRLFGAEHDYQNLMNMIEQGAQLRSTTLSDKFNYQDYQEFYQSRSVPLFAITARGQLQVVTQPDKFKPLVGWEVLSLILPKPIMDSAA